MYDNETLSQVQSSATTTMTPNSLRFCKFATTTLTQCRRCMPYNAVRRQCHEDSAKVKQSKQRVIHKDKAIKGRDSRPFAVSEVHMVTGYSMFPPFAIDTNIETIVFGMGCYWSSEKVRVETCTVRHTKLKLWLSL